MKVRVTRTEKLKKLHYFTNDALKEIILPYFASPYILLVPMCILAAGTIKQKYGLADGLIHAKP